jgi:hypothetical protein
MRAGRKLSPVQDKETRPKAKMESRRRKKKGKGESGPKKGGTQHLHKRVPSAQKKSDEKNVGLKTRAQDQLMDRDESDQERKETNQKGIESVVLE